MASQGPNNPGTGANDNSFGTTAWADPGNITSSNNAYATAEPVAASSTQYLKATNFGFSIPGGSTIDGIELKIERHSDDGDFNSTGKDSRVRLVKGGTVQTTDKASAAMWSLTDAVATYGGAADLWGTTWTADDINSSGFGAVLSMLGVNLPDTDGYGAVDHMTLRVYYTASSPPVNSVAPAVSGTAQVGQTLTSTTGTWSNTPTGYSYQWKAAGGNVGTDQNTYVPVVGDIGATITCTVTASNADGPGTPAESAATSAVLPAAPVAAFSGTPLSGTATLEVVFTDTSTNTPTEWVWERLLSGSGHEWEEFHGTPTAQNPTEEFGSGVWDVRLTATNAGGSDTETKLGYITVTEETTSSDQHTAFSWNKPGGWGW